MLVSAPVTPKMRNRLMGTTPAIKMPMTMSGSSSKLKRPNTMGKPMKKKKRRKPKWPMPLVADTSDPTPNADVDPDDDDDPEPDELLDDEKEKNDAAGLAGVIVLTEVVGDVEPSVVAGASVKEADVDAAVGAAVDVVVVEKGGKRPSPGPGGMGLEFIDAIMAELVGPVLVPGVVVDTHGGLVVTMGDAVVVVAVVVDVVIAVVVVVG